jgi:hypothetical protein
MSLTVTQSAPVEASAEVRASLGWGRGVEKAIEVENLQAFDA